MLERAAAAYSLSHCTVSANVGVDGSVIISLGSSRMFYSGDDGTGPQQPAAHHYGNTTCGAPSHRVSGLKSRNKNTCRSLWLSYRTEKQEHCSCHQSQSFHFFTCK